MSSIGSAAFLITLIGLWASDVARANIAPDAAKAAVRDFEGNPGLEFSDVMLREDEEGPAWQHRSWYDLRVSGYPDPDRAWDVDAESGEVTGAFYGDASPDEESDDPFGPLTQEQCHQIAEAFARLHYAGFGSMGLEARSPDWLWTGWRFEWRQMVAHGAWGISNVAVQVNPADGRIQRYSARRVPVPVPPEPRLTPEEAVVAAEQVTGLVTTESVKGPTLAADPDGIYWSLEIAGLNADGSRNSYQVVLNAVTGAALEVAPAATRPGPASGAAAPRRADSSVPVRNLLRNVGGASVHWLGKGKARVILDGRWFTLSVGSGAAVCRGGTVPLSAPVALRSGRLMVPADLLESLKRGSQ